MKVVVVADNSSFDNNAHGKGNFVQDAYVLFTSLTPDVYIQCPQETFNLVAKFVPETRIWTEPIRHGTAPALGLASLRMAKSFPGETVLFAFANQTVKYRSKLLNTLRVAESLYEQLKRIVVIGVAITKETNVYGYIEVGRVIREMSGILAFEMKSFRRYVEPKEMGKVIHTWKYLWDTGYVICQPEELLKAYSSVAPEMFEGLKTIKAALNTKLEEQIIETVYSAFPKTTFSQGIIEKLDADKVAVVPVDIGISHLFEKETE